MEFISSHDVSDASGMQRVFTLEPKVFAVMFVMIIRIAHVTHKDKDLVQTTFGNLDPESCACQSSMVRVKMHSNGWWKYM